MNSLIKPIFIISSERSGSNLLRTLLDNHSLLHGPRAPQLIKSFDDVLPYYSSLEEEINLEALFDDMKAILNHPFHDWKVNADFQDIASDANSFYELWQAFYSYSLNDTDAKYIVCKENNIFDYAFEILYAMPDARFLYLYRDPRDVAASWMRVPLGLNNVNQAAVNWNREQMRTIKAIKNHNLPVQLISYEALIENTPLEMTRLLKGLDLDVEQACFQTESQKGKELKWNKYWENLEKPVMSSNSGKYRKHLSAEEIEIIETRSKDAMAMLGYKLDTAANWQAPAARLVDKIYYSKLLKKKPVFTNKNVQADVNELILDRAKLMRDIRINRQREWKESRS